MNAEIRARVIAEVKAIEERIENEAREVEKKLLETQFGQRLLHLKARLEESQEDPHPTEGE